MKQLSNFIFSSEECIVCMEITFIKVKLECSHTFCFKCIFDMIRDIGYKENVGDSYRCPLCRNATQLKDSKNLSFFNIFYCLLCNYKSEKILEYVQHYKIAHQVYICEFCFLYSNVRQGMLIFKNEMALQEHIRDRLKLKTSIKIHDHFYCWECETILNNSKDFEYHNFTNHIKCKDYLHVQGRNESKRIIIKSIKFKKTTLIVHENWCLNNKCPGLDYQISYIMLCDIFKKHKMFGLSIVRPFNQDEGNNLYLYIDLETYVLS